MCARDRHAPPGSRPRARPSLRDRCEAAVADLAEVFLAPDSLEHLSSRVLAHAVELTGSAFGYAGFLAPGGARLIAGALHGGHRLGCGAEALGDHPGPWHEVLETGATLVRNAARPRGGEPLRRFLAVPARAGGKVVGQLGVGDAGRAYGAGERAVVERLAALYGLALARATRPGARGPGPHRAEFEDLLTGIAAALSGPDGGRLSVGFADVLGEIGRFAGADRGAVVIFSDDGMETEELVEWPAPGRASRSHLWPGGPLRRFPWIAARVGRGETVVVARLADLPGAAEMERLHLGRRRVRSFAAVPLLSRGEVRGLLVLAVGRAEGALPEDVRTPLRIAAELLVGALERRRAEEALRRTEGELQQRVRERTADLERAKQELERDIAARRRAEEAKARLEEELRRSRVLEAVGMLAGGVAHDFNNLLGSVIGCLYVAKLNVGDAGAEVLPELERAQALCKRGGELTRQLLTVARYRTGCLEPVDLAGLLGELKSLLARTLPRTIELCCPPPEERLVVRADRSLLTTAFLNLALNARDAMPNGGRLTLAVEAEPGEEGGRWAVVRVADTGIGIPAGEADRIFDPYFTTKGPGGGSGLGLSMVHATVSEAGGGISVRSAPGEGTVFTVRLPAVATPPPSAVSEAADAERSHPLTAAPVLVVEDEDRVAELVRRALRTCGYRTHRVRTGLEALERIREEEGRLGLVVLDLVLPELGGEGVYRLLRNLIPELPVLLVTGREDLARALDPAAPILAKPFTASELQDAVGAVLGGGGGPPPGDEG